MRYRTLLFRFRLRLRFAGQVAKQSVGAGKARGLAKNGRESHFRPLNSPFGIRALIRVRPQVVDNLLLMHTALMYMTVFLMVIDTQDMRAVRKYAFSVISRSF